MLATDWARRFDRSLPEGLVSAAHAISGLFDLPTAGSRPSINTALKLDECVGESGQPVCFWKSPVRGTLDAVVGGK